MDWKKIENLRDITGLDEDACQQLLELTNWDFDKATDLCIGGAADDQREALPASRRTPSPPPPASYRPPARHAPSQQQPRRAGSNDPMQVRGTKLTHAPKPSEGNNSNSSRPSNHSAPRPRATSRDSPVIIGSDYEDEDIQAALIDSIKPSSFHTRPVDHASFHDALHQQALRQHAPIFPEPLSSRTRNVLPRAAPSLHNAAPPQNPSTRSNPISSLDLDSPIVDGFPHSSLDGQEQMMNDEEIGFNNAYSFKYGENHPMFCEESFDDAYEMSVVGDRGLLLYVHHERSDLNRIFCTVTLRDEHVVNFINAGFVVFGVDLSRSSARLRRDVPLPELHTLSVRDTPYFALVSKNGGRYEVFKEHRGFCTADELLSLVVAWYDEYTAVLHAEKKIMAEKEARRQELEHQELEYQMSLKQDMQKEAEAAALRKMAADEDARLARERREASLREAEIAKVEAEIREEEERIARLEQERLAALKLSVSDEPPESAPDVVSIQFRVPGGRKLPRRFRSGDTAQSLIAYVASQGFSPSAYELVLGMNKVLDNSSTLTLAQLGLKKDVITVREKL